MCRIYKNNFGKIANLEEAGLKNTSGENLIRKKKANPKVIPNLMRKDKNGHQAAGADVGKNITASLLGLLSRCLRLIEHI